MPVFENLDRLAEAIRNTLTDKKAVTLLEPVRQSGYVHVKFHGHDLAVKLSGESFEIKNNNLFVTAPAMLLSCALLTKQKLDGVISAVIDSLREAEALAATDQEKAIALLESIKPSMRRLAGHSAK